MQKNTKKAYESDVRSFEMLEQDSHLIKKTSALPVRNQKK